MIINILLIMLGFFLLIKGADILIVYDNDKSKIDAFIEKFPSAKAANCEEDVLNADVNTLV